MRAREVTASIAGCIAVAIAIAPRQASADELRVHGEAGGTLPVGGPQSNEFGVGAGGAIAVELPLAAVVGVQLEAGGLAQSKASRPADPTLADHGAGTSLFGAIGARLRPFGGGGRVGGPWIDADFGLAGTGGLARAVFDAHLGHDFRVGSGRFDIGPFVGYTQIVQPSGTLRPEDAHILWLGVHVALGAPPPLAPSAPARAEAPPPAPPPPPPPAPPPLAAPPSDRDNDTVVDGDDACPDVPGLPTADPKTNGCPPAGDRVHLEGSTIVLDDVIMFDVDSPRVRHASWAIVKHVADFINANQDVLEVEIEGHADQIGEAAYNLKLSEARADSVKKLLVKYGVSEEKLTLRGHGATEPRATGRTAEALRQNRRVQFTVTRARPAQAAPQTRRSDDAPPTP